MPPLPPSPPLPPTPHGESGREPNIERAIAGRRGDRNHAAGAVAAVSAVTTSAAVGASAAAFAVDAGNAVAAWPPKPLALTNAEDSTPWIVIKLGPALLLPAWIEAQPPVPSPPSPPLAAIPPWPSDRTKADPIVMSPLFARMCAPPVEVKKLPPPAPSPPLIPFPPKPDTSMNAEPLMVISPPVAEIWRQIADTIAAGAVLREAADPDGKQVDAAECRGAAIAGEKLGFAACSEAADTGLAARGSAFAIGLEAGEEVDGQGCIVCAGNDGTAGSGAAVPAIAVPAYSAGGKRQIVDRICFRRRSPGAMRRPPVADPPVAPPPVMKTSDVPPNASADPPRKPAVNAPSELT